MLKIDMVRCHVISPDKDNNSKDENFKQERYIPLDIFRPWKFLMEKIKGFHLEDEIESFWVDDEQYSKDLKNYPPHDARRVVQICFSYYKDRQGGRPVVRYFPNKNFEKILQVFMRNFSDTFINDETEQTTGYFILPLS